MLNNFNLNRNNRFHNETSSKPRLVIMTVTIFVLFSILVVKLFSMQIMSGDFYSKEVMDTTIREVPLTAARGSIFDRYGRTVADNKTAFVVNIDPSISVENLNDVLYSLIRLLESNGEELSVFMPISPEVPHEFQFDDNPSLEETWKNDMYLDPEITADKAFEELKTQFEIDSSLSDKYAAQLIAIRSAIFRKRYSKYVPVQLACEISEKTVSQIQERNSEFPSIYVDTELLREYPYGETLSHILGYTGQITEEELEEYKEYSYTSNDIVGKDGIEKAFEVKLNGTDGSQSVEVDSTGKRISSIENNSTKPVPGSNVYLTIDAALQKKAYDAVEKQLARAQIARLTGTSKGFSYTISDVMKSIIKSDNIHIDEVLTAEQNTVQYKIKAAVLEMDKDAANDKDKARDALKKCYEKNTVTGNQILLAMIEQETINATDEMKNLLTNGQISSFSAVVRMLEDGSLKPGSTAMDPCTASAVVTDVKTGGVLTAVSYPSYDNNQLVNNFNNKYYRHLQSNTVTPMVNRPFTEPHAPGSVFKMLVAVAGLEEGFITTGTTIHDEGTFKDAGKPYANCWISGTGATHGDVDVAHALEVSCNYFFYTLSYSFGKGQKNNTGIELMNKYMEYFGFNDSSGVEIYELYDSMDDYPSKISSPEYKEYITKMRYEDPSPTDLKWVPGDTIRTAIGQSFNNYTTAHISKYIATLVSGGVRYQMHLLNEIHDADENITEKFEPVEEYNLNIDEKYLDAIFYGMSLVTKGEHGTLKDVFKDYPYKVAAKSGTAEEVNDRSEHTTFVAFAPYDDPQVSIAVMVPFGNDSTTSPAPNIAKEIISSYLLYDSKPMTKYYNTLTQ